VDDEAGPREALRMILKNNYDVILAEDPLEGLEQVAQAAPDLVFLDIKMPQMSGIEVLEWIKQMAPETEVAMITAYAAVESAQEALRFGALDYLTKPFGVDEVLRVVERALQRREQRRAQQGSVDQLQAATGDLVEQLRELRQQVEFTDLSAICHDLDSAEDSLEHERESVARLIAIGEIAAETAHNVDEYLAAMMTRIQVLRMLLEAPGQADPASVERSLQDIIHVAQETAHALARISLLPADPYQRQQLVQLNQILRETAELSANHSPAGSNVVLIWDLQDLPELSGSAIGLRTALMNVLINAREAVGLTGEIQLRTRQEDGWAVVEVTHNGAATAPSLDDSAEAAVFMVQGKLGWGLGLGTARKMAVRHGGTFSLESLPEGGARVTLRLPLSPQETGQAAARAVADVLMIDDDQDLLSLVEDFCRAAGLQVCSALDLDGGLDYLRGFVESTGRAPAAIVADQGVLGDAVTSLVRQARELAPKIKTILMVGPGLAPAELAGSAAFDAVLAKPFALSDLLTRITAPARQIRD
jgi:DNA-binding response OmpR family regulator